MTNGPSQIELVTLAVFLLGGESKPVDTEDVAMKAHELAPTRFSWRKYPQQVNLELVRVYLSAAKAADKGGYIDGSGKSGWTLTPIGLRWARKAQDSLGGTALDRKREAARGGPLAEQRWRRERERITSSQAWLLWATGERRIELRDAQAVFRIDSYATGPLRDLKMQRVQAMFEDDTDISPFLDAVAAIVESGNH